MDRDPESAWQEMPSGIARSLNPEHDATFPAFPMEDQHDPPGMERSGGLVGNEWCPTPQNPRRACRT